jgi:hypothetical protein
MSIHALLALDQRDEKLREVIRQLTNQRDEARRDLCERMAVDFNLENQGAVSSYFTTPDLVAKSQNWDCFKSDKQ